MFPRAHIAPMELNSLESLELGRKILRKYGSWSAARRAASYVDGVFRIEMPRSGAAEPVRAQARKVSRR